MDSEQAKWFIVLINGLAWSIFGATAPNVITNPTRSHNRLRLINECLARLQIAFVVFYLNFSIVVSAQGPWISLCVGLALLFYICGLAATRDIAPRLRALGHQCDPANDCAIPLRREQAMAVLALNSILALISALASSAIIERLT